MAVPIESRSGRFALVAAHCAGMVDLVALSLWVGALIAHYGFDPQRAGGLPTLFLVGAVLASVAVAPRIQRLAGRWVAACGYGMAALAFWQCSASNSYGALAVLHVVAGASAGAALSVTHGAIGRSANPHRLFAVAGMALGVFAVVFLAATPRIVASSGGAALFLTFAAVMAAGALACLLFFPDTRHASDASAPTRAPMPLSRQVWLGILGISCMTTVQAMTFSFLEGVGLHRGFGQAAINGVLIALGLVNLLPAALAALLQNRLAVRTVLVAGPVLQLAMATAIMVSPAFLPYAIGAAFLAAVLIFTHTFAFGLLARLDQSGRALSGTPAMLMVGSAIGPFLGGTLVKHFGYGAIALAAALLAAAAVMCFTRLPRLVSSREPG
jgi:predicted MFS family arabinose efflux permease